MKPIKKELEQSSCQLLQMVYQFTIQCKNKSAKEIWQFIQNGLSKEVTIKSIKEKIPYTVHQVTSHEICFSSSTRNNGIPETIFYADFETVINRLKLLHEFNTLTASEMFKQTRVYKKRSPFFALLVSSGVIEAV